MEPVTEYAEEDEHEAFAEAFETWCYGPTTHPELQIAWDALNTKAKETIALFETLAGYREWSLD